MQAYKSPCPLQPSARDQRKEITLRNYFSLELWNGCDWCRGHKSRKQRRKIFGTYHGSERCANYWKVNVSATWTVSRVSKRGSAGGSREIDYSVSKSHELLEIELMHILELVTTLVVMERSANVLLCGWNLSPKLPFIRCALTTRSACEIYSHSAYSQTKIVRISRNRY
jgi:hypothetical protein